MKIIFKSKQFNNKQIIQLGNNKQPITMDINLILEKSETGYSAFSENLPGLVTAGETIDEVKENFKEVLEMHADYLEEKGKVKESEEIRSARITYYLDLKTFFEYYSLFNKSELANYIGINPSLLRRLSSGREELSDKKALQIKNGLHKLANELKHFDFA
ncbi:type II toxin-antitoxin system HicB family antitoxin [Chryseobacterium arthrosphaerae]|uniref:Type II toxin-antitoxin system HicB family antitoxin n=1 Tax=Chryseobacterium arthrosphaerae TaxID=651561 RepID=A0ABU7R2Z8_9FLAO